MFQHLPAILFACVLLVAYARFRSLRRRREIEGRLVDPEELRSELESGDDLILLDVRLPLDLLAYPELIPGASRVTPKDILEGRATLSADRPTVVYCTCANEQTSRKILHKALELHLSNVKILRGGLAGWKAKGYPVEPYTESFHLDTPTGATA